MARRKMVALTRGGVAALFAAVSTADVVTAGRVRGDRFPDAGSGPDALDRIAGASGIEWTTIAPLAVTDFGFHDAVTGSIEYAKALSPGGGLPWSCVSAPERPVAVTLPIVGMIALLRAVVTLESVVGARVTYPEPLREAVAVLECAAGLGRGSLEPWPLRDDRDDDGGGADGLPCGPCGSPAMSLSVSA